MFRAELGGGNRDNALALLERLKARYIIFMHIPFHSLTRFVDNTHPRYTTASVASCLMTPCLHGRLHEQKYFLARTFGHLFSRFYWSLAHKIYLHLIFLIYLIDGIAYFPTVLPYTMYTSRPSLAAIVLQLNDIGPSGLRLRRQLSALSNIPALVFHCTWLFGSHLLTFLPPIYAYTMVKRPDPDKRYEVGKPSNSPAPCVALPYLPPPSQKSFWLLRLTMTAPG